VVEEQQASGSETRDFEVRLDDLGPCKKLARVEYAPKAVQSEIEKAYNNLRKQVRLKGFRPGKAPRKVLQRRFGDDVLEQVRQILVSRSLQDILAGDSLELLLEPEPTDIEFDPKKGLTYEVTLVLRPVIEIPPFDGLEVEVEPAHVSADDIEKAIGELNSSRGELRPVEDEGSGVELGDKLVCDIQVWLASEIAGADEEDSELKPLKKLDDIDFEVIKEGPQVIEGLVVNDLGDDLQGLSVDESVDVDVVLPSDYELIEGRNEPAVLRMTVLEIKRLFVPDVDDALAKAHNCDSLEDFRSQVRDRLLDQAGAGRDNAIADEIVAEIQRQIPEVLLPDDLIESELQGKRQQYVMRCLTGGMSREQAERELLDKDDELRVEAMSELRTFFVLDAVAKKENISVEDAEVRSALVAVAEANGRDPQELLDHPSAFDEFRIQLLQQKVKELLRGKVTVKDAG